MSQKLADFLLARTRRERWLLGLAVVLVLPLGWYQGVILPLKTRAADATQELEDSRSLQLWLEARRTELEALPEPEADSSRNLPSLGAIESSLQGAGLEEWITTLAAGTGGGITLQMDGVEFTDLMPWLDRFERETGYRVAQFAAQRGGAPGRVVADILLQPEP